MQPITYKGLLIGIKIDKVAKGSNPITDPKEFVQVVTLKHSKGSYLLAHMHQPKKRVTAKLQECLIVRRGKIKLDLYSESKKLVKSIFLTKGQGYISLNGGVGIKIIQDAEIIEVKNGPFKEDKVLI